MNQIFNIDCLNGMKELPNSSVDLIITDPPFNIGKEYNSPYKDRHSKKNYIKWCKKWLIECVRLLKDGGSFYLINYPENNAYLVPFLDRRLFFKRWMTWHYPTNTGHSKYNFTRSQHSILFYTKSSKSSECVFNKEAVAVPYRNPEDKRIKKRIEDGSNGKTPYDVFTVNMIKNISKEKTGHPCQLPLSLIEIFVKASSNKGDLILDPFMGSGTVAIAAILLERNYIGFEISSEYCKVIKQRINNIKGGALFGELDEN